MHTSIGDGLASQEDLSYSGIHVEVSEQDLLLRAIVRDKDLRVSVVIATGAVREAARRHGTRPGATAALGRGLTSGLLLATLTKGNERVTVQIAGDGPVGKIIVDATNEGDVRGYVVAPEAGAELPDGRIRLADIVGRSGVVNIVRDLGLKDRYQGQVALTSGEIDEDIEAYLRTSEQVPSALCTELVLEPANRGGVVAAAGILVQALPGGDPSSVRELQHALRTGTLHDLLVAGERSPSKLAEQLLEGCQLEWIGAPRPVRFQCRCSQERINDMLRMLSREELAEMIAEGRPAEVTCNFCNEQYSVTTAELERIRASLGDDTHGKN